MTPTWSGTGSNSAVCITLSCVDLRQRDIPTCSSLTATLSRLSQHPQDPKYVALGWVRGLQSANQARCELGSDDVRRLPSTVTLLMTDSLLTTKALGYRYVWVDKFCIHQCDEHVKREQIRHMNSVYECWELHIIAAQIPATSSTYQLGPLGAGLSKRPC